MTEPETRETPTPPEPVDELRKLVGYLAAVMELDHYPHAISLAHAYLSAQLQAKSAGTRDAHECPHCSHQQWGTHCTADHPPKSAGTPDPRATVTEQERSDAWSELERSDYEALVEKVRGLEHGVSFAHKRELKVRNILRDTYRLLIANEELKQAIWWEGCEGVDVRTLRKLEADAAREPSEPDDRSADSEVMTISPLMDALETEKFE